MSTEMHNHHYETHHRGTQLVAYGGLLGITDDGVPVISNGDELHFSCEESITPHCLPLSSFDKSRPDRMPYRCLGYKWQCVELVRRYVAMRKATWMISIPTAADMWTTDGLFHRITDGAPVKFTRHSNGSQVPLPAVGDLIVWDQAETVPFGHVAVVVSVTADAVNVAEQNQGFEKWPEKMNFSRAIPLKLYVDGSVGLIDEDPILGWISIDAPFYDFTTGDVADYFRIITSRGQVVRRPVKRELTLPWLDLADPCDFYQKRAALASNDFTEETEVAEGDAPSAFYYLDYDMWCRLGRAAASLHDLAMRATDHVLKDPDSRNLLENYFGVPYVLQPLLLKSWEDTPPLGGRFDFGYDGRNVGLLEYNCDSSGTLLECCNTQDKMARYYGITLGESAGSFLKNKCIRFFQQLLSRRQAQSKQTLMHFMVDDEDEERYTALCMMGFAEEAGLRAKLCVRLERFCFADSGPQATDRRTMYCQRAVLDDDGEEVTLVWKSWSWDTVLHQFSEQATDTEASSAPTLSDILLNSRVQVLEPLWKAVTGSKAILPFMHALAPDHENMVPASFLKTKEIISHHHVSKPVNGRAGQNIVMHEPITDPDVLNNAPQVEISVGEPALSSYLVASSSFERSFSQNSPTLEDRTGESSAGNFSSSIMVYQKRIFLKVFDGKYFPIFCAWMTDSEFSGVVVREDTSKITKLSSVVIPTRVVRENVPL